MIYKFQTTHCPMCRQADHLLRKHQVKYLLIDAEEETDLVTFYGVRSVPCLIAVDTLGEPAKAICHAPQSEPQLLQFLSSI